MTVETENPAPLWTPSAELLERSEMALLRDELGLADAAELHAWSIEDIGRFWRTAVWDRFGVLHDGDPEPALADARMPGARWFPNVALSFPEHVFRDKADDAVALHAAGEVRDLESWTWGRLRGETARIRAGLRAMGVGRGDRVVGYLPHVPETVAAFLAVSSLGATWSCCSPDFGTRTVVDRFAQIEPKVLLATDGYRYGGRSFDRTDVVAELERELPSIERVVRLGYVGGGGDWDAAFPETDEPLAFERVPFDHPLWILYSSGTTGLPKAIVHGHGGIVLEHLKTWRLQHDTRPGDRVLWFTTTGWVMWNYLVAGLMTDASIVLFDGNPGYPDLGVLWDLCEQAGVTVFGTGAAYLHGCLKAGLKPAEGRDLSRLRAIGSTGSPLSPEGFRWVFDELGGHIWLFSASGGTDIAGAFVGANPLVPVHLGELQAAGLGVDLQAWDDDGNPVIDEVGELVVTQPMPSMPVRFWNDPGDVRYRESYFDHFAIDPPVWRHGDWIRITPRGSAVIYGRSDSTINRGGIRMGTAEIYAAVLALDEVADAMVVDVPPADGTGDAWMPLFVVLAEGAQMTDDLAAEIRRRIRSDCSPRHVPDEIHVVAEVPRTLTGKVLEVPVKKLLMGHDPERAASRDALANPDAFAWFVRFAEDRRG
jgi:acetoacetyl-CoA synthetase